MMSVVESTGRAKGRVNGGSSLGSTEGHHWGQRRVIAGVNGGSTVESRGGGGHEKTPTAGRFLGHGKLVKPSHQITRENSRNQGPELPNATNVPQSNVAADVTHSEDDLNLMPGNAAGTATPVGIPVSYWSTRKTEG